jgi:hypothetical protein
MTTSALPQHRTQESCDHPEIVRTRGAGRGRPYQQFEHLRLPEDLDVPTCTTCGEVFAESDSDADAIDCAMEEAWRNGISEQAKNALQLLVNDGIRKRDLETLLGLSPGYLSKVAGAKEPSALLAATLTLLSASPQPRIQELRAAWNPRTIGRATTTVGASARVPVQSNVLAFPTARASTSLEQPS